MDPNNPQDQTGQPAGGQPTVGPAEPVQPGQMPTVPSPEPNLPTEPVRPETPVEAPEPVAPTQEMPTVPESTPEPQGEGGGGTVPPATPTY